MLAFYQVLDLQIFSLVSKLPFNFVDWFLCWAETLFDIVPIVYLYFVAFAFGVKSNNHHQDMSKTLLPMFSLRSFMVLVLTFLSILS